MALVISPRTQLKSAVVATILGNGILSVALYGTRQREGCRLAFISEGVHLLVKGWLAIAIWPEGWGVILGRKL